MGRPIFYRASDVLSLALSIKISKHQLYLDADRETFFFTLDRETDYEGDQKEN